MKMEDVRASIPDFGRDIRLNLEAVLAPDTAPGLTPAQIWGIALACAHSVESKELVAAVHAEGGEVLMESTREAARGAATIMGMNNVYYRAIHLMGDPELKTLPARLRMNIIGKPGIEKADFELMCFAVSALSGCGQCMTAHLHELRKAGVADQGIHSALRIASVFQGAQKALQIRNSEA